MKRIKKCNLFVAMIIFKNMYNYLNVIFNRITFKNDNTWKYF